MNANDGPAPIDYDAPSRKQLVREGDSDGLVPPKKIAHLQFGLMSAEEIQRIAEFQVTNRDLFTMPSRKPAPGGCLDPRLGVSDKYSICSSCKRNLTECAGHYGYIKLALPVFHIGFLKHTVYILQCICKTCSRVLLLASDRQVLLKRMRNSSPTVRTHDALFKAAAFKKVLEKCKKVRVCPFCRANNGTVKKISGAPTMKIIHERYKGKQAEDDMEVLLSDLGNAMQINPDVGGPAIRSNLVEDLTPTRVLELFQAIPDYDCDLLWMDVLAGGRPDSLILTNLLVPPAGSNEDDLTIKLQEILDVNILWMT